jgi:integrase
VIHGAKKAIARVRRRMNVDFRGHDLRRTAASIMASAGVSRLVVAKVLNHVETGVTAVYDRHSYDAEKRAALDLWGRQLQRILRRKSKASVIAFEPQPAARQATA